MKLTLLGGGLASLSLAYFLQENPKIDEIEILEKECKVGGLCRSFVTHNLPYDIGPHIIFSKDSEILNFLKNILGHNATQHRRSNQIIYKNRFIQYPFENDLSKLPEEDLNFCVNSFLNNPYDNYLPQNMLQFFLKTFGEGITNIYLRPYNEKIWKFDPSFMDTQMVERIPKPPNEDIIRSAKGETIDGYLHQLYFSYPREGGIESIISNIVKTLNKKVKIITNCNISKIESKNGKFNINTTHGDFRAEKIVSSIPANQLINLYTNIPENIRRIGEKLRYNSEIVTVINLKKDRAGNNFAFNIPEKEILFHRLTRIDFLGECYHLPGSVTYLIEVTYRCGDRIDKMSNNDVLKQIIAGLNTIGFLCDETEINFWEMQRFQYAYVIYDLAHRENMDSIKKFFASEEITLNGRFGEFEYLNMDTVIKNSMKLARTLIDFK